MFFQKYDLLNIHLRRLLSLEASPIFCKNRQYLAQAFDTLIMSFSHYQNFPAAFFSCSHSIESQWCYLAFPEPGVQQENNSNYAMKSTACDTIRLPRIKNLTKSRSTNVGVNLKPNLGVQNEDVV